MTGEVEYKYDRYYHWCNQQLERRCIGVPAVVVWKEMAFFVSFHGCDSMAYLGGEITQEIPRDVMKF
jgi:hypothetical protein